MPRVNYNEVFYRKRVTATHTGRTKDIAFTFNIELRSVDGGTDCKVGDFANNFWLRTRKGKRCEKYTNEKRLELAVVDVLKKYHFDNIKWLEEW